MKVEVPSYDHEGELEETVFGIVAEVAAESVSGMNLEALVQKKAKKMVEDMVEKAVASYLGMENRYGREWELKSNGRLYKALDAVIAPMVGPAVQKVVGDELELDPAWVKEIAKEASEEARHEVQSHIRRTVFSTHGLDREIRGPVHEAIENAVRKVATEAVAKELLKDMPT